MKSRVVINSGHRVSGVPNSYTVTFQRPLKDVSCVTLVSASLPCMPQTKDRDTLFIDGHPVRLDITKSTSQILDELVTTLSTMAALNGDQEYNDDRAWHARARDHKLALSSTRAFSITAGGAGLRRALGLPPSGVVRSVEGGDGVVHTIVGEHRIDAEPASEPAVVMFIEGMPVVNSNDPTLDKAFAVLPMDAFVCSEYRPNAPIARVHTLRISFFRLDGVPYDFGNRDHVLQFDFSHGIQRQQVEETQEQARSVETEKPAEFQSDIERFLAEGILHK